MNAPRTASLVAALAVTTWSCAGHVADTSIAPGDRVRVTAPSMDLEKGVGTVAALETDTLVVNTGERADALEVPLADVTKLEVHRGQKSRTGRGALIGAGVGALAGVATVAIACASTTGGCDFSESGGSDELSDLAVATALVLMGTVVGAGVGAIIGLATRVDRWQAVPLDDIRVGPSPVTPDGVAVSVTLRL